MALLTKPNMQQLWASGGDIVEPTDLKKQQGWTVEVPPHQFENWIQNRQDEYLAHINQRGLPAWDALTEYEAGGLSYVQGTDGKIYKSVAASGPSTVSQNPVTDGTDTYWTIAFADVGAFITEAAADAKYVQLVNGLNTLRINVASASTINLTTSAPNTRHINITGGGTINGFTVAAGQCYFTRFDAAGTLVNSASIVTNSGANIAFAAGDSCVLRATAANVVEVILRSTGTNPQNLTTNGYKIHADGSPTPLIEQWGRFAQAPATTGNIPVTFPIQFPNECFGLTIGEYTGPAPNWIATVGLPTTTGFTAGSVQPDQGYMWFAKGR